MEFAVDDRGHERLTAREFARLSCHILLVVNIIVVFIVVFIVVSILVVAVVEFVIPFGSMVTAPTSHKQGNAVAQDWERGSRHDE